MFPSMIALVFVPPRISMFCPFLIVNVLFKVYVLLLSSLIIVFVLSVGIKCINEYNSSGLSSNISFISFGRPFVMSIYGLLFSLIWISTSLLIIVLMGNVAVLFWYNGISMVLLSFNIEGIVIVS